MEPVVNRFSALSSNALHLKKHHIHDVRRATDLFANRTAMCVYSHIVAATTTHLLTFYTASIFAALSVSHASPLTRRSLSNGIDLRILPLGDSITYGYRSSDGNGYRLDLLDQLAGNNVTYIGSLNSGSMTNNANEGWSGYRIAWIGDKGKRSFPERPNVILLMAGTNDMIFNDSIADAPTRLGTLIDECILACPDAVVIVAQITPLLDPLGDSTGEDKTVAFNAAVPAIVQQRVSGNNSKIVLVDMQNAVNGLSGSDLYDGIHPTDAGYAKMANIWMEGLRNASSAGWITAPVQLLADGTTANVTSSGVPLLSATASSAAPTATQLGSSSANATSLGASPANVTLTNTTSANSATSSAPRKSPSSVLQYLTLWFAFAFTLFTFDV